MSSPTSPETDEQQRDEIESTETPQSTAALVNLIQSRLGNRAAATFIETQRSNRSKPRSR